MGEEERLRNPNASCELCAHFIRDKVERIIYKSYRAPTPYPEKVFLDYCSSYREVIRNNARAEKCRRWVEKKKVGALDDFISS